MGASSPGQGSSGGSPRGAAGPSKCSAGDRDVWGVGCGVGPPRVGSPFFVPPVPSELGLKMLPVRRDGADVLASAPPPPRPRAPRPASGSTALGPRGSCTMSSAACRSCRWIRHTARAAWSTPKPWEESWAPQQARRNWDSLGQGTRPPLQPHPSKRCRALLPSTPRGVICNLGTLGRSHRHHIGLRDTGVI